MIFLLHSQIKKIFFLQFVSIMTSIRLIICVLFIALFSNCSTSNKIVALRPEPSKNTTMAYQMTTSIVNMPMEITLKEIENQLNKALNGQIYEDLNITDDKTEMKIWKTAPIKITEKNGKIESVIPLKIWAKFKYGTDFMGLNDTREIDLNGTITLTSDVKLSNWKMNTSSVIENFDWNESPTLLVAGKKVPITYIINPTLSLFKSKVAKKIDDAIDASCDFKPYVLDVLEKMSTPFQTSQVYETWFKMNPLEMYVTDAQLKKSKIVMQLGLKCNMITMVGQSPKPGIKRESIVFKSVTNIAEQSNVSVAAVSSYESASRIITKNFQGKEFTSGKRKVVIRDVALWAKDGKMIVALQMTGSLDGTIYLSGIPNYNPVTKEIYFENMEYVLNTKGLLTKTANWLLQGVIVKKIEANCRYSIKDNLAEGKKNILPYLTNYSPMKGVFVNGTLSDFEFDKVELTQDAIIAFISTQGKISVSIDGME